MKKHYVSPYETEPEHTICGKPVTANIELVADMKDATCESCRKLLIGYCNYRMQQIFTEMVNVIDFIDMKVFLVSPHSSLKPKIERLKNLVSEVFRLRKIEAHLQGVM